MMSTRVFGPVAVATFLAGFVLAVPLAVGRGDRPNQALPQPLIDSHPSGAPLQTAIFAGGCFWGVQGVFEHVKGVTQAVSGYTGGHMADPTYEQVSSGTTGHAESVSVTFDPGTVTYGTLLRIFFSVALDPTQKDRQGPDWGTQYRSELFVNNAEQARVANAYVAQLEGAHIFDKPIATRIEPAGIFYPAEAYHQDYLDRHPNAPYIAINDLPKVEALRALFPESWEARAMRVSKVASAN